MRTINALSFSESAEEYNRYAELTLDATIDTEWAVALNGTDNNGDPVIPLFVVIDNYNNEGALTYSVDNLQSGLAGFTSVVLQISPRSKRLLFNLSDGIVNLRISEKKLPVTEGTKYTQGVSGGAAGVTKFMFITAGSSFIVPSDWNNANNKIHCIGAGANGEAGSGGSTVRPGGGGGAYARKNNVTLAAGATKSCQIGIVGGSADTVDTWAIASSTVLASGSTGQSGGEAIDSIGDVKYDGGDGNASGGGGGAGGITAAGGNGTDAGGAGGGTGGGAGGAVGSGIGGDGTTWTQTSDSAKAGPGGGGGAANVNGAAGGAGGNYGAGGGGGKASGGAGGAGKPGLIVLEWTP